MTDGNPIKLYPELPNKQIQNVDNAFRLQKINDAQNKISVEKNECERSYKIYNNI